MEFLFGTVLLILTFGLASIFRRKALKNISGKRTTKDIPSLPSLPVIGILHHLVRPGIDIIGLAQEFVRKYGKILRTRILMHEFVALIDPVHIEKALGSTNPGHLNIPEFIGKILLPQNCSASLYFAHCTIWKRHKKVLSRLFTQNGIENQIKLMNRHSKNLVHKLGQSVDHGLDYSVGKMLHRNVLDMILELIFGREMLSSKERALFSRSIKLITNIATRRFKEPWLLIPPVWWLHPLRRQLDTVTEELKSVTLNIVEKYQGIRHLNRTLGIYDSGSENEDDEIEIKRFKCAMELMIEAVFDNEEIIQETVAMIMGGNDVATSITYLLFNLARHPQIQEICRNEVDQLFEAKRLLNTSNEEEVALTVADLNSLEYLDRCVKENLRLAPIAFGFARQLATPLEIEEDLELDSGTILLFSPWITHRDTRYYPEPENFDPDRFLPEEVKKRHPYTYIPFSSGVRNCIAYKSAPLTIKLVTAYILRNFVVETTDKWEDLEFPFEIAVTTKKDINFILKRRVGVS